MKPRDSITEDVLTSVNNIVLDSRNDPEIYLWEKAIIEDFASRVSLVLTELENFETEGKSMPQDALNTDFRSKFNQTFYSFLGIPTTVPTIKLLPTSVEHLQKIWIIALNRVMETIEKEQVKIGIKDWSLIQGVGFPVGVGGTISVTFKGEGKR